VPPEPADSDRSPRRGRAIPSRARAGPSTTASVRRNLGSTVRLATRDPAPDQWIPAGATQAGHQATSAIRPGMRTTKRRTAERRNAIPTLPRRLRGSSWTTRGSAIHWPRRLASPSSCVGRPGRATSRVGSPSRVRRHARPNTSPWAIGCRRLSGRRNPRSRLGSPAPTRGPWRSGRPFPSRRRRNRPPRPNAPRGNPPRRSHVARRSHPAQAQRRRPSELRGSPGRLRRHGSAGPRRPSPRSGSPGRPRRRRRPGLSRLSGRSGSPGARRRRFRASGRTGRLRRANRSGRRGRSGGSYRPTRPRGPSSLTGTPRWRVRARVSRVTFSRNSRRNGTFRSRTRRGRSRARSRSGRRRACRPTLGVSRRGRNGGRRSPSTNSGPSGARPWDEPVNLRTGNTTPCVGRARGPPAGRARATPAAPAIHGAQAAKGRRAPRTAPGRPAGGGRLPGRRGAISSSGGSRLRGRRSGRRSGVGSTRGTRDAGPDPARAGAVTAWSCRRGGSRGHLPGRTRFQASASC
jgi:hypothetical protein